MEKFYIYTINNCNYKDCDYLLMNLTYESILNYINDIQSELESNTGSIIIDQLLATGDNINRFIKCNIIDGKLDLTSASSIKPAFGIVRLSESILGNFPSAINNSILSSSAKQELLGKRLSNNGFR